MTERIRRSSREPGQPCPAKDKTTTTPAVLVVRSQNQDLLHEAPAGQDEQRTAAPPPARLHRTTAMERRSRRRLSAPTAGKI